MGRVTKTRKQFPGATYYKDRHGNRRWRFRQGGFSAELGTSYGSDEFIKRYEAALENQKEPAHSRAPKTTQGSISALIDSWYRSPDFMALEDSTKRVYRGIVEPLRLRHGRKPVHQMRRRHVEEILADKAETPNAANNLRKRLIQLLDHSIKLEWRDDNPAKATKPYSVESVGFHTWEEEEIEKFLEKHPQDTLAHTTVTLMLFTGAARVDAVKLGPLNIRNGRLQYRRQKTKKKSGVLIDIPVHPELKAVLDRLPKDRPFLATGAGNVRSENSLGNMMRSWCDEAGLPECTAHGLRKACARRLAEAGATAHQIMAVTGHKTLALAQRYTVAASRKTLADSAFEKMSASTKNEQKLANRT